MDDQLYREIILEHWKNPQNFGILEDADIDITDYNPLCGDEIRMTIKFRGRTPNRGPTSARIEDIKFVGHGCAISQASASIITELAKSMTISEIRQLDQQSFLENIAVELTAARLKCALLPYSTLQKALHSV